MTARFSKYALLLICLLLAISLSPCPAWATFAAVQQKTGSVGSGSTCSVTVTATGTGHAIIVGVHAMPSNATITSVSGGGTYTHCPNCANGNGTAGFNDMAYTLASVSGDATITITVSVSQGSGWACSAVELSGNSMAFDTSGSVLDSSSCTSCAGVGLTLSGTNDAIVQISGCGQTCSGTITGWTTSYVTGDGNAYKLNTNSGTAITWSQSPSSVLGGAAIALKEVAMTFPVVE